MKRLMLCAVLTFAPVALAVDAGVADAGAVLALDAGAPVLARADAGVQVGASVDAGAPDAGVALVTGDDVNVVGIAKKLKEAGHAKSWTILFSIISVIVVLTWLARKVGGSFIPFLKTDRGGALTVLLLGVSGGVLNALAAGDGMSLNGALSGAVMSFMAAGGFNLVKKLVFPSDPAAPAPAPPVKPA
jgi:hypothetical protein